MDVLEYKHGVYVKEEQTSIVSPSLAESSLAFVVGTAPVHNIANSGNAVNEPKIIYNMQDFESEFGGLSDSDNEEDFTLWQAANIYFNRYRLSPMICVNVFDPEKHKTHVKNEAITLSGDIGTLSHSKVSNVVVKSGILEDGLDADSESGAHVVTSQSYSLSRVDGSITRLATGEISENATIYVSYDYIDPLAVTKNDIVGGVDAQNQRSGLALVDEVFARYRLNPAIICAPKWSKDPTVAKAIESSCVNISGFFRAIGIIGVSESVETYSQAPEWLSNNNLHDQEGNTICFFGDCLYNGKVEPGDIHLLGCIGKRDVDSDGIPYWSPSNCQMECEGMTHAGRHIYLTPAEANYLNSQGIVTGLNMTGALVAWGDQTTAYPGITDVKNSSIPIRRMFTWIGNTLIRTNWQYVSTPVRRRMIENVQDTVNQWLNGLVGRDYLLGARCDFENADNPTSDLIDGKVRWHIYIAPPQAGRELTFILEYEPSYLGTLFTSTSLTSNE